MPFCEKGSDSSGWRVSAQLTSCLRHFRPQDYNFRKEYLPIGLSIPNAFNAMQMSIDEQYLEHIDRKVKSGNYPSPDAVMAKALTLLDEHDESLAEEMDDVQGRVREGMEALRKGATQNSRMKHSTNCSMM